MIYLDIIPKKKLSYCGLKKLGFATRYGIESEIVIFTKINEK